MAKGKKKPSVPALVAPTFEKALADHIDRLVAERVASALAEREKAQPVKAPEPIAQPAIKGVTSMRGGRAPFYSPEDVAQAMVQSMKTYGTIVPPADKLFEMMTKRCPHCKETKAVKAHFGVTTQANGNKRVQGWCNACRKSPDSHPTRYGNG